MTLLAALPLLVIAAAIVVPLVREYAELRSAWGVGRLAALAATSTLFPSLGIGLAVAYPFHETPAASWMVTVAVTVATYSAALAALRPSEAPQRSS
jgi:hypothetical protein